MKSITLNRNLIKIIALITMLIDHIGYNLLNIVPYWLYITLRIIGRLSFPLFAYFIAEGFYYTRNKVRYLLTCLAFAIISQLPHALMFGNEFKLNIMFTFVFSILIMFAYDALYVNKPKPNKIFFVICFALLMLFAMLTHLLVLQISFRVYGILLPFLFYVFKGSKQKQILAFTISTLLYVLMSLTLYGFNDLYNYIGVCALISSIFIAFYNGEKGKLNLKYLFYLFYPLHMLVLYLIF